MINCGKWQNSLVIFVNFPIRNYLANQIMPKTDALGAKYIKHEKYYTLHTFGVVDVYPFCVPLKNLSIFN